MCAISAVYDFYRPKFDDLIKKINEAVETTQDDIFKTINDFHQATEAAKVVDELTEQPNCADPEKAKLEERVAELEDRLRRLENKVDSRE